MAQTPSQKSATEMMTSLREEVAAQDAAQAAQFTAIMGRKPARPRKVEPELDWLISKSHPGKKTGDPSPAVTGKSKWKKPGKQNRSV